MGNMAVLLSLLVAVIVFAVYRSKNTSAIFRTYVERIRKP